MILNISDITSAFDNISIICRFFAVVKIQQIKKNDKEMTANLAIDQYLSSLDPVDRIAISRRIRRLCRISRFVLSDWRRGRTPIPWSLHDKIIEAIGKNIFENVTD